VHEEPSENLFEIIYNDRFIEISSIEKQLLAFIKPVK
jgi:hypothetical protein